ncbi:uncharacterized protein LOC34619416 [Cyclospora cayetanensis]|uniref:Uncharacterized protein LOC34619416 n=1 Tax=Cyclospora cayetanensis TaxID=88456 RepID=A0A6P6RXJ4_9EIME|nr:uncharacterized protein LOC34619416 [Cyclospora cayetanensis]
MRVVQVRCKRAHQIDHEFTVSPGIFLLTFAIHMHAFAVWESYWNVWARLGAVFLLDVPSLLRPLPATNELGPYPLNAPERAFVLVLLLLLALVAAIAWPRAVYAQELYERQQELENIKKEQEFRRLRRESQARPSVTAMLTYSMRPTPASFQKTCKTRVHKLWNRCVKVFYFFLGRVTRLRAAITLFLLPACLAVEVPLIFCTDQADVCASPGLLLIRIVCFVGVVGLLLRAVCVLHGDMREATVSGQGKGQEEYLRQREIEYLLFLNNDWMDSKVWLVSSFKGGFLRSYCRIWLLVLKAALIVSSGLLGQQKSRPPTGLGWLAGLGSASDAISAVQAAKGTLGKAIAAEPLGEGARTAVAAGLVLFFCIFAIILPPFRCRSSNCIHVILFLHFGGVSGIGLAAAGAEASRSSFLLYSNQHLLLALVHLCTLCLLLATTVYCWICCFLPTESLVLNRYEVAMGYVNSRNSSKSAADSEGTCRSFIHNVYLVTHLWRRRCILYRSNTYDSWSSSSSIPELGVAEINENNYGLQPFEAPWPTRHQHARFWIRIAPMLVEQLAASSVLVQRYAVTKKQLLPVHLANAGLNELERLIIQHVGVVEAKHTRISKTQKNTKSTDYQQQALERLLLELSLGSPPTAEAASVPGCKFSSWNKTHEMEDRNISECYRYDEGLVFKQHKHESEEILETDEGAGAAAAVALPQALAFKHLERAAHLSKEFSKINLRDLQDLQTIIKAVQWTVTEVFEKMSAIHAAALAESIWQGGEPPSPETQKLLHDFAIHLKRRKRQMALVQPLRERILLKLLAIRFLTDTPHQREKNRNERKEQMDKLFGEESSVLLFSCPEKQ